MPGDDIIGFITRGQGVSIHRKDCRNYSISEDKSDNSGRWIRVSWADNISESYITTIIITAKDRAGLVLDIAALLNTINAKVHSLSARNIGSGNALAAIKLEIKNSSDLRYVMGRLGSVPGVSSVNRNGEKSAKHKK